VLLFLAHPSARNVERRVREKDRMSETVRENSARRGSSPNPVGFQIIPVGCFSFDDCDIRQVFINLDIDATPFCPLYRRGLELDMPPLDVTPSSSFFSLKFTAAMNILQEFGFGIFNHGVFLDLQRKKRV
jgi:hypothetical protein